MDWHYFGHAMWLVEAGDLRILFDPLIDGLHHGDVFEVEPRRKVDVEALRPDFLVVSHAHGDHFDLPSLHRLAQADPDTVVLSADEMVVKAARALGFRTASVAPTDARIDLDGARLVTTPSDAGEVEWGMMVKTDQGVVWNQIDSYHPAITQVPQTLDMASKLLETDVRTGLPLALVRWQPVLETQAPMAKEPGFPFSEYAMSLGRIAEIHARAVVPAAAGVRQTAAYDWMNHYVYPVPHRRAMRDIAARAPGTRVLPPTIGATFHLRGGDVAFEERGARHLVEPLETFDPRRTMYRPYEMPRLVDPNPRGRDEGAMRATVATWLAEKLLPALAEAMGGKEEALRFAVEVVFPRETEGYTLHVGRGAARLERTLDDDYDVINTIAGSLLVDVIEGRRAWGDPLLGGMIRATLRAYELDETGLLPTTMNPVFLYYGLPYEESLARAIDTQIAELLDR